MRDWTKIDSYLDELAHDVYDQEEDIGHTELTANAVGWSVSSLYPVLISSVLDVGCGTGFAQEFFKIWNIPYTGVNMEDGTHENVENMDYNFLTYPDNSFDLVFSRHSLEHSPFPIITLMEWHRVAKRWLSLVMPNPDHYTWRGRNHYSLSQHQQVVWWMRRAGWKLRRAIFNKRELWFLAEKMPRISYEGWAKAPLNNKIYEFERDHLSGDVEADKFLAGEL